MIEVKDGELIINGVSVGDEKDLLSIFKKAALYNKLEPIFKKDGDA